MATSKSNFIRGRWPERRDFQIQFLWFQAEADTVQASSGQSFSTKKLLIWHKLINKSCSRMLIIARITAIAVGISFFIILLWLIWDKLAPTVIAGIILSVLAFLLSTLIGALFGEHFSNFLRRNLKRD
jgi:hypothetical protein